MEPHIYNKPSEPYIYQLKNKFHNILGIFTKTKSESKTQQIPPTILITFSNAMQQNQKPGWGPGINSKNLRFLLHFSVQREVHSPTDLKLTLYMYRKRPDARKSKHLYKTYNESTFKKSKIQRPAL